jgi:methionyl-tRNA formyltransferase
MGPAGRQIGQLTIGNGMSRQEGESAFGICAVGFKGAEYLANLLGAGFVPEAVFSYSQSDDISNGIQKIAKLCNTHRIDFHETRLPEYDDAKPLFFVGWQYLVRKLGENFIVFHDSMLPKYRGFAPTVNALINGERRLGVTAFKPDEGCDSGPIIAQLDAPVTYPMRIEQALRLQAALMAKLTMDILPRCGSGYAVAVEQDHATATYSIWRDQEDYRIDWSESAATIMRMVDAVSFPYGGATTNLNGLSLFVDAASEVDDLVFQPRHPGKIWRFDEGRPVVICGRGLLRLDRILTSEREAYVFERLRVRLS